MLADDRAAARVTLRGGSVGTDRGDATFIGAAIVRLSRALRQTAELYREGIGGQLSNPLLRHVAFGHSVTLELEIGFEETVEQGLDGARRSPTIDAARTIGELLLADPDVLLSRAVKLGGNATGAYRTFLKTLAKDSVILEWQGPDGTVVEITSDHARRDVAILASEGDRVTTRILVDGTLTMADAGLNQFKLTLPSDTERPPVLKGKHVLQGSYAPELTKKLKDEGLWDSEVTATIDVTYDVPDTTPKPIPPLYTLVEAEPRISLPSLFDLT